MSQGHELGSVPGKATPSAGNNGLSQDERAELERLRAEKAKSGGPGAGPARRRHFSWRTPVSIVLIVLGCVVAPVAVLGVWAGNEVSDTGRWVATVEPLIHDPAIQNVLTDKITAEITSQLNLTGTIDQASTQLNDKGLPRISSLLKTFGPQIASAVTGFIHSSRAKACRQPGCRQDLGAGQYGGAPGGGQGALRTGQRRHQQHEQRSDRAQPRPVHRRGQAGSGRARVLAGEQHPAGQPDRGPVPGEGPRQGTGRLPADHHPQDRAADRGAAPPRPPGCTWPGIVGAP